MTEQQTEKSVETELLVDAPYLDRYPSIESLVETINRYIKEERLRESDITDLRAAKYYWTSLLSQLLAQAVDAYACQGVYIKPGDYVTGLTPDGRHESVTAVQKTPLLL